ncbi:hypothetical protein PUNSTDRAFT_18942, partial [Punctularia strigosozonata HHB-11173 SS5]|uniref:uncharacterized protein n=1 Tax=Punctularia strigosozonata (strain HHB-11173) TaxID=741275 RepID=UPI00044171A5
VDLSQVGAKEAAEIESAEHKALGYRPPKDSLAAAAKSAAAEHPTASAGLPKSQLAEAAREDALRTVAATGGVGGVGLDSVGEKDARTIQSEEHKALGYRPPPGSLAAEAQSAAAKHPAASTGLPAEALRAVADVDALATELERAPGLENVGEDDARTIQSAEHKALGYRPPPGTLAAEAQSAAAKHPDAHMGLPKEELQEAAVVDAALTE